MKTLILNTYGGSLLLGSIAEGADVIGSYESAGYGSGIQEANFPNVPHIRLAADWPSQSLRDVLVLAHPPCAPFSVSSNSKNRGIEHRGFADTYRVLDYAMQNEAKAIAIESVRQACDGAFHIHIDYAARYGYNLFRIFQNAIDFGMVQIRKRFWALFLRQDSIYVQKPEVNPVHKVSDLLEPEPTGYYMPYLIKQLEQQKELTRQLDIPDSIYEGEFGFGPMSRLIKRIFDEREEWISEEDIHKYIVTGKWGAHQPIILNPIERTNALMAWSFWICRGRPLTDIEYKRIMGFPDDYIFPDKYRYRIREFLARGVCPPVARWIYRTLRDNVNGSTDGIIVRPNEIFNLDEVIEGGAIQQTLW